MTEGIHRKALLLTLATGLATATWACVDFEPTTKLVIPTDERPVEVSDEMPPPVNGGTLTVLGDGATVIAADPARDRVSIANAIDKSLIGHVALEDGDQPGRVVEGPAGTVYVALGGADAVATLDIETRSIVARRAACGDPRGMAYDTELAQLHVACRTGDLVTFDDGLEAPSRRLQLEPDLRDVLLGDGDNLLVTRLKSAELLEVTPTGAVVDRDELPSVTQDRLDEESNPVTVEMTPSVAWRAVSNSSGEPVVVHQRGQVEQVGLTEPTPQQPSSYGGGGGGSGGCGSIVHSAVTTIVDGRPATSGALPGSVLPVDVAVSDGGWIAVANAGVADPEQPRPFVEHTGASSGSGGTAGAPSSDRVAPSTVASGLTLTQNLTSSDATRGCAFDVQSPPTATEPIVAVAFTPGPSPTLVAQQRQPAKLLLFEGPDFFAAAGHIDLGGGSVRHTGHELFHRDTGAGIACASCHPGGDEDGRVWTFEELGPRRTQPLAVGLDGTEPFHWDGTLGDMDALMEEVMVGRMGGVHQTEERIGALEDFIFELERPAPIVHEEDPAALRGRDVFEQAECSSCHAGPSLTNNETYDVGTGGKMQVPSLVGVGHRAPFIHTGCADTLEERFDPDCGGGQLHGETKDLSDAQVDDLVAYLRTL